GVIGSRALCDYMAMFLNFDINSYAVPVWIYAAVVIVGIAAPLIAAAYPVWRGTGVPVRMALTDFGLSRTTFGASAVDRLLARIGGPFSPFVFAIRNCFRRRARLALTLLTLAAGGLFFLAALNVRASIINTLDRMFAARKFDLAVTFSKPYAWERIQRAVGDTPGITHAEGWFFTEGVVAPDTEFTVAALPLDTKLLDLEILEGRFLQPGDTNALVINNSLAARAPSLRVGQTVTLRIDSVESNWRVVGLVKEAYSPAVAYIPLDFMRPRQPGMTNSVRLALAQNDFDSISIVKQNLDRNLEQQGVRARGSSSKAENRFGFDQHMLMIYIFLIVMSAIVGSVGALGLMTTMSLNVLERRREMGVLRAIGATPRVVWLIVVVEGLVIGIVSWTIAAVLAWPVSKALGDMFVRSMLHGGLDFSFEPRGLLIWFIVSISVSAAGSFLPAWKASRTTVREALAYE
ncbi:MAG TPA: FtsX-like permease family protein, partial [Pyrinomonadaceae bacterium]|nr:FtsX-like permease family protein [Pyrinomonadaceae bacterium]